MGQVFDHINEEIGQWITQQQMFFVASAPLSSDGHVNCSPKGMDSFRIEVGHKHEVKPANIVGAIANEAGLSNRDIGHIEIKDDHSLIELPKGMPKDIFNDLKDVWVSGQKLKISKIAGAKRKPKSSHHSKDAVKGKKRSAKKKPGKNKPAKKKE